MADIELIKGADNGNPPDSLRQMYPKVNRNFQNLNAESNANANNIEQHKNSKAAHTAQDITYSGPVPGDDVKEAIDIVNGRISEIVAQSGDDNTEIVDARGGFNVLSERLDANDQKSRRIDQPLIGRMKTVQEDENYNCWPTIVRGTNNRLFVFYGSGQFHKAGYSIGRSVKCKYSDNNGLEWSDEVIVAHHPEYDFFSFSAIVLSTGDIVCIVTKGQPGFQTNVVYRSEDNGLTFVEGFDFDNSTDQYVSSIMSPNVPIEFEDGRLMLIKDCEISSQFGTYAIFSTDGGVTWNSSAPIVPMGTLDFNSFPWEVRTCYLGGGRILAIGRHQNGNPYQLTSTDYGQTWKYSLTNISDCIAHNAFPVYLSANGTIALYYTDRRSNVLKKRVVDADFIFNKPTSWPNPTIIDYTSSPSTAIDSGYVTAVPMKPGSLDVVGVLYTTRTGVADNDTAPRKTSIVTFFDKADHPNQLEPKYGVNRQALINGSFDIWQRGDSFNSAGYAADRWYFTPGTGNTATIERMDAANERRYLPNNPTNIAVINRSGGGAGSTFFSQRIEDVKTFNDEYISFSFYAKCDVGTFPITVYAYQNFGSGGSAAVSSVARAITVRNEWVKFEGTVKVPSIDGKIIGLNNYLEFSISIPVSSGVNKLYLSQMQLNLGQIPLPYSPRLLAEEKMLCERYCIAYTDEAISATYANGFAVSDTQFQGVIHLPTEMRRVPTLRASAADFLINDGVSAPVVTSMSIITTRSTRKNISLSCFSTGLIQFRPYRLIANGTANRILILDAEF